MPVTPGNLDIVICGHLRHAHLQTAVRQWAETTPGYHAMYVIANHPSTGSGLVLPERATVIQTGRVPNHAGQLSATWNLGFQWTFVQNANIHWVILSQDDVHIHPGWLEHVNAHPGYLFYNAPAGDMVMLISREAYQRVGWFDEHVRTIGGQDLDWIARAVITLGADRISSEDGHGWSYNPIGLTGKYWESSGGGHTPGASYAADGNLDGALKEALRQKWGISTQQLQQSLKDHVVPTPANPEFNWYPWITR